MAACGSLSSLFEKPRPENPTLMESLSSWSQILAKKPVDNACSFTEIFGELHFQEKPAPPPDSNHSFPLKSSDKLQLCTERLGSESSDDVDDLVEEEGDDRGSDRWKRKQTVVDGGHPNNCCDVRKKTGGFPPPISSIGKSGKPWIYFKSYRHEGRFPTNKGRLPATCLQGGRPPAATPAACVGAAIAPKKDKAAPPSSKPAKSGGGKQKKKWSKGKQKEKVNNAVLFDQVSYDKMLSEVPKFKQITPSVLSERLRVKRSRLYPVRWIHFRILHHFTSRK
ncbi:hypothetical protein B296_00033510 [Ensete ventricosum]|uniref:FAF domain-containing protein n=1 Tax=Ensete ventricosum TaxID=4639 RepID=A0A426XVC4_ENSVE|nr:hypothetical protein B296_00033510 [Ensete ventricosum]